MPRGEAKRTQAFADHYSNLFGGAERWSSISKELLRGPPPRVAVWNRYCSIPVPDPESDASDLERLNVRSSTGDTVEKTPNLGQRVSSLEVFKLPHNTTEEVEIAPPPKDDVGIAAYLVCDFSAVLVTEALQLKPYHKVLDICSAPGIKSICIAQQLTQAGGSIVVNDVAGDRVRRMQRVLEDYLPHEITDYTVCQRDGTRWHQPLFFDRVVVDPPCSNERHLVGRHNGLVGWTPNVPQSNFEVQILLLLRGFESVKVGGRVVYSVTALHPTEGEEVVKAALRRTRCDVRLEAPPSCLVDAGGHVAEDGIWKNVPGGPTAIVGTKTGSLIGPLLVACFTRTGEHRPASDDDSDASTEIETDSAGESH